MSDDSVEFVIKAVKMVAEHGWKLLPQVIKYNLSSGLALLWWVGRRGSWQTLEDRGWERGGEGKKVPLGVCLLTAAVL